MGEPPIAVGLVSLAGVVSRATAAVSDRTSFGPTLPDSHPTAHVMAGAECVLSLTHVHKRSGRHE